MNKLKCYTLIGFVLLTSMLSTAFAQEQRRSRSNDRDREQETSRPNDTDQEQEIYRPNDSNRQVQTVNYKMPFYSRTQLIEVEIVNGEVIFEGDIILGVEGLPVPTLAGNFDSRWKDGIIPFVLDKSHSHYQKILTAIDTINRQTNLSLVQRTTERDYVEFVATDGCASAIGRKGGKQTIKIENCSVGSIMHEIMHAAGFYHEQSRSDRDDYVTINWDNIKDGKEYNFKTYEERELTGTDIGKYDYYSLMHYGANFFSKNGKPTITPIDSSVTLERRNQLSLKDLQGIRSMYPAKAIAYQPMFVEKKIDTDLIAKPEKTEPMVVVKPKKSGLMIKP